MLKTILLGSGSNVLVLLVKMGLTFIMAPILLHNLGNYDYGLWEMLGAVIGYMGMLDLGIRPAITRFSARYDAENNREAQRQLLATGFVFMAAIGVLLALSFAIWGIYFPHSLAQEGSDTARYTLLCLILSAQFLLYMPGYVAEGMLEGLQKYHIKNLITLINSLLGSAIIFNTITPENGLVLLAGINALGLTSKYIIYFIILSGRSCGGLSLKLSYFSRDKLLELLRFGSKSLIQGVSHRIESATDTLVIGWFMGPAMVPLYSIPANLVGYLRSIGWNIAHVFMPVFSNLSAAGKQQEIVKVYLLSSKYMVAIMTLIATGVVGLGDKFISIWMGSEYGDDALILIMVLVGYVILPLLNPFASRYLTAIDQHGVYAKYGPVSALVNLILSIILVGPYGIIGVALGSLIPIGFFVLVYLRCSCKHLGIGVSVYIKKSVLPSVLPIVAMASVLFVFRHNIQIDSYFLLLLGGGVAAILYVFLFWLFALDRQEKEYILKKIKR